MLRKILKICGVSLLIIGILCGVLYTQLYNSKVVFTVNNDGRAFPLTEKQKIEDFEYLYNTLKNSFPYFEVKKREYSYDWLSQKDIFIDRLRNTKDDREYYYTLTGILSLLQNGHTNLITPGNAYDEYKRLYSGPQPWSQIYNNRHVSSCYQYWSSIIKENDAAYIPVGFKYIEGKYYAYANMKEKGKPTDNLGIPMGALLVKVAGVDTDKYIESLMDKRTLFYDKKRNKLKLNMLYIRSDSDVELQLELPSGEELKKVIKPYKPENDSGVSAQKAPEHMYSTAIIEKDDIAYLKIPDIGSFYVDKDGPGIRKFLENVAYYKSLIIDIRGNGGGSTDYWQHNIVPLLTDKPIKTQNYILFRDSDYIKPFIKSKEFTSYFSLKPLMEMPFNKQKTGYYFSDNKGLYQASDYSVSPKKPVGFKGKIFLLVDDYVYSSAEAFAAFAKATGWATLIGTHTGGDGIGFDPVPIALPNSGLIVRFPAEMGLNPDGTVNEEAATAPDIYVEQSIGDFEKQVEAVKAGLDTSDVKVRLPYDTILRKAIDTAK